MAKILVIEDRSELREGILELLETENFEAIGAATGEEAIQLALSQQFDLILCDIIMPGIDGYQVLDQLRQERKHRDIPFIFLTAKSDREYIRLGMNLGADDYLTKPCTNREILEAIFARLQRASLQTKKPQQILHRPDNLKSFDWLTGLPNVTTLVGETGYLQQAIAQTSSNFVAFLLLDLDQFTRINEVIGYVHGDEVLQILAQRLTDFIQRISGASAVRLGGDEFAIILPQIPTPLVALKQAQTLLEQIAKPIYLESKVIVTTGTIGISFYPVAKTLDQLRHQAGIALRFAKRAGRNCCQIYQPPSFGLEPSEEQHLAVEIFNAWEHQALEVCYQPRLDLKHSKVVGTGVVVQWHHPRIGLLSPETISIIAQESGFHRALEQWLIQMACQQLQSWQRCQIFTRLILSVSEATLNEPDFPYPLIQFFQTLRLDPRYIELEIPATAIAQTLNIKTIATKLLALKSAGISTTIAQFGSGLVLPFLGDLALDAIKLDRGLMADLDQNKRLLKTLINRGHDLNLKVIADGVQSEVQMQQLRKQRCDEAQQQATLTELKIKQFL